MSFYFCTNESYACVYEDKYGKTVKYVVSSNTIGTTYRNRYTDVNCTFDDNVYAFLII